jgi:hypothetical protein
MANRICPVCSAEYLPWVQRCSDCGVALVEPAEAPNPLELPEDEQVVYELGGWPLDKQGAVAEAMAESGIPHAWDGAELVIHIDHESEVDAIVEAIEEPDAAAVDEDSQEEVLYDLTEWPAIERERLDTLLADGGVPHRYEDDGLTLVIARRDESLVETLLDQAENPDALEVGGEANESSSEALAGFFLAASRLRKDPLDPDGIAALLEVLDVSENAPPPFGVSTTLWQNMIDEADLIADSLADDDIDIAKVVEHASVLRNLARPFV